MKNVERELMDYTVGNKPLAAFENIPTSSTEGWKSEIKRTEVKSNHAFDGLEKIDFNHIENTLQLAESICMDDDRTPAVSTDYPNRFICRLIITAKNGSRYVGSGFFVSPRCIITSGHCLHFSVDGGETFDWAESIQIIPGADGEKVPFGSQISQTFRTVKGWAIDRKSSYDHGAIILPDHTLYKRVGGFFGCIELTTHEVLTNTGYPADKKGTPWTCTGTPTYNGAFKIGYMLDTMGGNSGSPVYIHKENQIQVVGVHGYGGCPNHCVKVRDGVLKKWNEWKQL